MEQIKFTEYEIGPKKKFGLGLNEIRRHNELLYFFTWRDIKVKYKQTFLGFLWAILQPLLMTVVFTLAFSKTQNQHSIPYPLFVCSGFVLWNIFATGIAGAGNSMVNNANIIKKIYFPRLIIPISAVFVSLFDFVMTVPILIAFLFYYHVLPEIQNCWMFPLGIVLATLATLGPGCLLAALNVKYRDFRYVIPFLVQFLMFVTLFIFPENLSKENWVGELFALNPMYAPVAFFRAGISGDVINYFLVGISCASSFLFFFAGILIFRKTESYFADLA